MVTNVCCWIFRIVELSAWMLFEYESAVCVDIVRIYQ
jgi:hypothetical protein